MTKLKTASRRRGTRGGRGTCTVCIVCSCQLHTNDYTDDRKSIQRFYAFFEGGGRVVIIMDAYEKQSLQNYTVTSLSLCTFIVYLLTRWRNCTPKYITHFRVILASLGIVGPPPGLFRRKSYVFFCRSLLSEDDNVRSTSAPGSHLSQVAQEKQDAGYRTTLSVKNNLPT